MFTNGRESKTILTQEAGYGIMCNCFLKHFRIVVEKRKDKTVTKRKAHDGNPYAGNPHARFDEGGAASAMASCWPLLGLKTILLLALKI